MVKEQLARLAASRDAPCDIERWPYPHGQFQIVRPLNLVSQGWTVSGFCAHHHSVSSEYFESLQAHAVPLDEPTFPPVPYSAMALDNLRMAAQRLHRIPPGKPITISWIALHNQFWAGDTNPDRVTNSGRSSGLALKRF